MSKKRSLKDVAAGLMGRPSAQAAPPEQEEQLSKKRSLKDVAAGLMGRPSAQAAPPEQEEQQSPFAEAPPAEQPKASPFGAGGAARTGLGTFPELGPVPSESVGRAPEASDLRQPEKQYTLAPAEPYKAGDLRRANEAIGDLPDGIYKDLVVRGLETKRTMADALNYADRFSGLSPADIEEKRKFIAADVDALTVRAESFKARVDDLNKELDELPARIAPIEEQMKAEPNESKRALLQLEAEKIRRAAAQKAKALDAEREVILDTEEALLRDSEALATRDYSIKAARGSWLGAAGASLAKGQASVTAGAMSWFADAMNAMAPDAMIEDIDGDGKITPKDRDAQAKMVKRDFIAPFIRKGIPEGYRAARVLGTTDEYYDSLQRRSILAQGALGLGESIPAMVSPGMAGIFLQVSDQIGQEMEGPEFDGVSELEKAAVKTVFAVPSMLLERFGLRNLAKNTAVSKAIVARVLPKVTPGMTAGQLNRLIEGETRSWVANAASRMAGGALAEAETGGTQAFVEQGTRMLYNELKGKDLLKEAPSMAEEVMMGGVLEAIGGGIMSAPFAMKAALGTPETIRAMDSERLNMAIRMVKDADYEKAFVASTEAAVKAGRMQQSDVDRAVDDLKEARDLVNRMPDNVKPEDQKEVLALLQEKKLLEGKDRGLVKDRIAAIDERLRKLVLGTTNQDGEQKGASTDRSGQREKEAKVAEPASEAAQDQKSKKDRESASIAIVEISSSIEEGKKYGILHSDGSVVEEDQTFDVVDADYGRIRALSERGKLTKEALVKTSWGRAIRISELANIAESLNNNPDLVDAVFEGVKSRLNQAPKRPQVEEQPIVAEAPQNPQAGVQDQDQQGRGAGVQNAYVTRNGKYRLSITPDGYLNEERIGEPDSRREGEPDDRAMRKRENELRRKAVIEWIKSRDFSSGKTAADVAQGRRPSDPVDYYVASENAAEIANAALSMDIYIPEVELDAKKVAIARNIGRVREDSAAQFGDRNTFSGALARAYFNKNGNTLDQVAQSAEAEMYGDWDPENPRITPDDVWEFMGENPSGPASFFTQRNPARQALMDRFSQLAGFVPTEAQLKEVANQYRPDGKEYGLEERPDDAGDPPGTTSGQAETDYDLPFQIGLFDDTADEHRAQAEREYAERTAELGRVAKAASDKLNRATADFNARGMSLFDESEGNVQPNLFGGDTRQNEQSDFDRIVAPLVDALERAQAEVNKHLISRDAWINDRANELGRQTRIDQQIADDEVVEDLDPNSPIGDPITASESANRVISALRAIVPNLSVRMHTAEEFRKQAARHYTGKRLNEAIRARAFFDPKTGSLHINQSLATANTLFHEAAHPVLEALVASDPPLLQSLYDQMLKDPAFAKYVKFGNRYTKYGPRSAMLEAMVEFMADVATGKVPVRMDKGSLWQQLKAWVKDLLAMLGYDIRAVNLDNPKDIRELAGKFAHAVRNGIAIRTPDGPAAQQVAAFQLDAERLVDGWYSRLYDAVAAKGSTMPASQWKKWLEARAKEGMLSLEEAKWTGISDFLASKGDEKVTPQQVREFLKENRVTVEVKEIGGNLHVAPMPGGGGARYNVVDEDGNVRYSDLSYTDAGREVERHDRLSGRPKFSKYQLPGASNYREVLVTLPQKKVAPNTEGWKAHLRDGPKWAVRDDRGMQVDVFRAEFGESEADAIRRAAMSNPQRAGVPAPAFKSSHFDEPNILVHLRLNDRVVDVPFTAEEEAAIDERNRLDAERKKLDASIITAKRKLDEARKPEEKRIHEEVMEDVKAGRMRLGDAKQAILDRKLDLSDSDSKELRDYRKLLAERDALTKRMPEAPKRRQEKVLFIEELQSDWGQEGKKKGFGGKELTAERRRQLQDEIASINATRVNGMLPVNGREETAQRLSELRRELDSEKNTTPSAPFVTSTDAWVELGMKQAIRMAVEGGYDKIAWTTGEQQFNRWGSQVFAWSKGKTGWRIVGNEQIGGEAFDGMEEALAQEAKESDTIITSKEELRDVVEDVMGRERSDYSPENWKTHINKMVDGMWERMQNEDSGTTMPRREGMKGFYDKILPAVAKKVSKKLGGDGVVGDVVIGKDRKVGNEVGRQQSISITPEMKAEVEDGVPLMQIINREAPKTPIGKDVDTVMVDGVERPARNSDGRHIHPTVEGVRNFWRWFGESKVVDEQGRPLVVYHAGKASIDAFRVPAYFTSDLGYAKRFGQGGEYSVYLNISKPLDLFKYNKDVKSLGYEARFGGPFMVSDEHIGNSYGAVGDKWKTTKSLVESLNGGEIVDRFEQDESAADGVIGPESLFSDDVTTYVALSPAQIKSATGNNGYWSDESASIVEQKGFPPEQIAANLKSAGHDKASATAYMQNAKLDPDVIQDVLDVWDDAQQGSFTFPTASRTTQEIDARLQQQRDDLKKRQKKWSRRVWENYVKNWEDARGVSKDILRKAGANAAVLYLNLTHGASGAAKHAFSGFYAEIFKGLNHRENQMLSDMIQIRRDLDIHTRYDNAVRPAIKSPATRTKEEALQWLRDKEQENPALFNKLEARANSYFTAMRSLLDLRLKEGLISQELHDRLISHDYSPREFIHHMMVGNTLGKGLDVEHSGIKQLEAGSEESLFNDAQWLLAAQTYSTIRTVFANRANRALFEFAMQNPNNGVVHTLKSGEEPPAGYKAISHMSNGELLSVAAVNDIADPWLEGTPEAVHNAANMLRWVSGVTVAKTNITGINPVFALGNLPRDIGHVLMFTNTYNWFFPVGLAQMLGDMKAVGKDALFRKGRYAEFVMEGGSMEFMTRQGNPASSGNRIAVGAERGVEALFEVLGWMNETSEITVRLAIRDREIRKLTEQYRKQNGGQDPTGSAEQWIKDQATAKSREQMDFSQGGRHAKMLDAWFPYLNVAFQGTRVMARYARTNPALFSIKLAQLGAIATSLVAYNLGYEDDYEDIPWEVRRDNWIIMLPNTKLDKQGRRVRGFVSIPKSQDQRIYATVFESMTEGAITGKSMVKDVRDAALETLPVSPEVFFNSPATGAMYAYVTGYDTFRDRHVWSQMSNVDPYLEYYPSTPKFWSSLGKLAKEVQDGGVSPLRAELAFQKYTGIQRNNFWTGAISVPYDMLAKANGDPAMVDKAMSDMLSERLGDPFVRKYFRWTSPRSSEEELERASRQEQNRRELQNKVVDQALYEYAQAQSKGRRDDINKRVGKFIDTLPKPDQKRLLKNYMDGLKEVGVPGWFIRLKHEPIKGVRTYGYIERYMNSDTEERKAMEGYARKLGLLSEEEIKAVRKLSLKEWAAFQAKKEAALEVPE